LQAKLKEAQEENEKVKAEKRKLQVEAGELVDLDRDELLAEAQKLKDELVAGSTAEGKVPEHLQKRLENIQRRLAEMGLAAGQQAAATKRDIEALKARHNVGSLQHLWNRILPLLLLASAFAGLAYLVYSLTASQESAKVKKVKKG